MKISAINVMMDKCKVSGDPSGIANVAQLSLILVYAWSNRTGEIGKSDKFV